jgi:hypothetical protein
MTRRPHNGRMRPNHSLGGAFAVGGLIASLVVLALIIIVGN